MDTSPRESFRGLLLGHRGRTGLTQRELATRAGVSRRSVQDWEAGVTLPSAERLQAIIRALLEAQGLTPGREMAEARELWTAVEREAPRMHTPFDQEWFAGLLAAHAPPPSGPARDGGLHPMRAAEARPGGAERAQDWGEAPDTTGFVGRAAERDVLCGWVLEERCRLVAVLGMGGIGKTSLAAWAAQQVAPSFERVYWRSLRNAPPVTEWLAGAIGFLSDQQVVPPVAESEQITALLQLLRARRCLLVLDNSETLFEPGQHEGQYRAGMEGYGRLLQAVGEASHRSCLLLTSREAPPELAVLGGAVRAVELYGLGTGDAQALLAHKQLIGDTQAWLRLVDRYGGNGLALKIVGETIRQVYDGDIGVFLADAIATHGTVFGGIRRLLAVQAERLSPIERDVLARMAVEREPINLAELSAELAPGVGPSTVIEAIENLRRRSLVERVEARATFTLQSMVLEYVTDRLVETVADEIDRGQPALLVEQPLIKAQAKDYVRQTQERLIGAPILQRLNAQQGRTGTERQLLALLNGWRGRPVAEQGYGPGNVVNLLRLLRGDLRGMDLSRLALRQVYLQGVDAQDVSVAGTHLAETVLTEAFLYPTAALALNADGAFLAAGTPSGELRVWRTRDRTLVFAAPGHTGLVGDVALSEDGRLMASSGFDGAVRLWDVPGGQPLATLHGHSGTVWGVALLGDGHLVASGSWDGTVRVWDPRSGQLLSTQQGHTDRVWGVALSRDGRLVASGGDDGTVRLWEPFDKLGMSREWRLRATLRGHTGGFRGVALSGDGRLVAGGSTEGTVIVWETASGQLLATLEGHTGVVHRVALSCDGRLLASSSYDGMVRLWDVASGQLLAILQGHTGAVWAVALSGDGRLVASSSWDGTVRLWEAGSRQLLATLQGHTAMVRNVALSRDGRLVASTSYDGTVRLWQAGNGQLVATLHGHSGAVWCVALSNDGQIVASGSWDGSIRLWESGRAQLLATLHGHAGLVWGVAVSDDGQLVASGGVDGMVRLWAAASRQLLATLQGHTSSVQCVGLSGDGRLVASGGDDRTVRLWDTRSGQLLATLHHTGAVHSVGLSGDGRLVASGGQDETVRLWEVASGRLLTTLQGHTGVVQSVALSGDGQLVASGGQDGVVRLWEPASGRLLASLQGHTGQVRGVAVSGDGRLLVSSGEDGMVMLWETATAVNVRTLRSDRHYERLDITGLTGVTEAQRAALFALGAIERAAAPSAAPAI